MKKAVLLFSVSTAAFVAWCGDLPLIPWPRHVVAGSGSFEGDAGAADIARDESIPAEGYRLRVKPQGVSIVSSDAAGAFYARQTLRQLAVERDGRVSYPCVEIEDSPEYAWRGILLDECRHFFGKETVKAFIDLAARHKYNVFHWHLMDDPGWRIESPSHPELVRLGSVRPESQCHGAEHDAPETAFNGQRYGPFYYTHAEVREILAYAAERHVRVMPEVELPGHARAALAAYPELCCRGRLDPREPQKRWAEEREVYCAGNDATIRFLERMIDETCELFPFAVVHIGGDEVPKDRWRECPKCQRRIRELGLNDEEELQGWMTRHFTEYLAKKGRRAVGWEEILKGGVPTGTVVMAWRGSASGIAAAKAGCDVIMTPDDFCYLDYRQGLEGDPFQYIGGRAGKCVTLAKAYSFDPMAGIPENCRGRILGGQANCWSEYTWNEYDLAWKTWPRACAIAEALWTGSARNGYADFRRRMVRHRERLVRDYVNCAPLEEVASGAPEPDCLGATAVQDVAVRDGIGRTLAKLQSGEPVSIAYFGGSITQADGWRPRVTAWLRQTYAKSKITEINASIGGTASELGAFRYSADVAPHRPDLIFVEFACNDESQGEPARVRRSMEGIVRQIWRGSPETDIVFVYVVTDVMRKDYAAGRHFWTARVHEEIAERYGIPSVCFARRVLELCDRDIIVFCGRELPSEQRRKSEKVTFPVQGFYEGMVAQKDGKSIFSMDGTHPTPGGYALYANCMKEAFGVLAKRMSVADHARRLAGKPLAGDNLENAKMVTPTADMRFGDWRAYDPADSRSGTLYFDTVLKNAPDLQWCMQPGSGLRFRFRGTKCGLYALIGRDSGCLEITVDGKPAEGPRPYPLFDRYGSWYRLALVPVYDGPDGVHEVEVKVANDPPDRLSFAKGGLFGEDPVRTLAGREYQGTNFFLSKIALVGEVQ